MAEQTGEPPGCWSVNGLTMSVRGVTLRMRFDTAAWLELEEEFGSLQQMYELLEGDRAPMTVNLKVAAITARCGAKHAGEKADITWEWLRDNLTPKQARKANTLAKIAMAEGMKREEMDDEDEAVDVVAEELQKKTGNG